MKIVIDIEAVRRFMHRKGIRTYRQLCAESGISENQFRASVSKNSVSKEMLWLIADSLECHMEEICKPDWTLEKYMKGA